VVCCAAANGKVAESQRTNKQRQQIMDVFS
jgi:hypothetical protein